MRQLIAFFIACAGFMGCAQGFAATGSERDLALQRRATLDRIATECGVPASIFDMTAANDVRILLSPEMPYEGLDCAFRKLQSSDIPLNSMGFVGNEAVEAESTDASPAPERQPVFGWTVYAPARTEDGSFARFIVSGPADAVDEFTRESEAEGWILEARASTTALLVFAQYRAPIRPVQSHSFMDRFLRESPRRLNIAGVVSKAETQ